MYVLPHPGGPYSKMPFGMDKPYRLYCPGSRTGAMTSLRSNAFSACIPATLSKPRPSPPTVDTDGTTLERGSRGPRRSFRPENVLIRLLGSSVRHLSMTPAVSRDTLFDHRASWGTV